LFVSQRTIPWPTTPYSGSYQSLLSVEFVFLRICEMMS
jgi:hypothetical protein